MAKKSRLPYDKEGGVQVISRRLMRSPEYLALTAQAKALMHLMHSFWTASGPIGFGVRQAEEEIPCSRKIAMRAFSELAEAGFIEMIDESLFCSRTQSKTRTWRLTWMPCWRNRAPTNDWDKSRISISTGVKTAPAPHPQVSNMHH
jgi:hypothetical protein